jgi:hypothetical protein
VQQEQPLLVNQMMREFLDELKLSKSPKSQKSGGLCMIVIFLFPQNWGLGGE